MRINSTLAEIVGIIIGDGNIYYNTHLRKYYVEITGNLKEKEYFEHISRLFKSTIKKPGRIRIVKNAIRIRAYSKNFVEFLINDLNLSYNKNKCHNELPSRSKLRGIDELE